MPELRKAKSLNYYRSIVYEEKIIDWVKEHPFLEGDKIQNAVFECYIISELIQNDDYHSIVLEYVKTKYKDSFVLFFLYDRIARSRRVHPKFLKLIYASLKSLDLKGYTSQLEVEEIPSTSTSKVECELEFTDSNKEYVCKYEIHLEDGEYLDIGYSLSNTFINAPIKILLSGRRCELIAPISISCSEIKVNSPEFVVECPQSMAEVIVLECNNFQIDYESGNNPKIINHLGQGSFFNIFSDKVPEFPFIEYFNDSLLINGKEPDLKAKYLKLRRIIMQFRSHSKGVMAKFKDKIHHRRVIGTDGVGQKVLDSLIKNQVLTWDAVLYYIDDNRIHEVLGVSYLDLKTKIINEKTIEFLSKIN